MRADLPIPSIPLPELLDRAAARHPRRPALLFFGRRITYRRLLRLVDRCAAGLQRLGVRPGDRVALILPNCPQQVVAFFATLRIGAIVVPHNPLSTEAELRHQLCDSGARAAIVLDRSFATLQAIRPDLRLDHVIVTSIIDFLPARRRLALRLPLTAARRKKAQTAPGLPADADALEFAELLGYPNRRARQVPVDPATQLAAIQYTGGTTGRPKGVMLTHRNLIANACQQHAWDLRVRDGGEVTLAVLPLFHSFGQLICMVAPVMRAGAIVLLPRFEAGQTIKAIRRERPTIFPGVPTLYRQVLDAPGLRRGDLRSIRLFLSGAVGLDAEVIEGIERVEEAGAELIQAYGLTEAAPAVTSNPIGGGARNLTVGLPLPRTEVVIVDVDDPTLVLPPDTPGELVVRGPQVFAGYWNQPIETARVLSKGWLRTGDIGVMSPDGFVTILERQRDMIKVSGFSVFPSEVEDVLRRHPAVIDCAVVGLPDHRRGEKVVAYVVEHPAYPFSAEELRRHCEKYLTHYKLPQEYRPRPDLPRNMIGKVLRRALRDAPTPQPRRS